MRALRPCKSKHALWILQGPLCLPSHFYLSRALVIEVLYLQGHHNLNFSTHAWRSLLYLVALRRIQVNRRSLIQSIDYQPIQWPRASRLQCLFTDSAIALKPSQEVVWFLTNLTRNFQIFPRFHFLTQVLVAYQAFAVAQSGFSVPSFS